MFVCSQWWPSEQLKRAYFLGVIVLSCYTLPLLVITVLYSLIGYRVCHRDAPGFANTSDVLAYLLIMHVLVLLGRHWLGKINHQCTAIFGILVAVAGTSHLVMPPIKLSTVGSRAFPVAAAQVWNSLPESVVSSSSLQTFRRHLNTQPFRLSYPSLILDC